MRDASILILMSQPRPSRQLKPIIYLKKINSLLTKGVGIIFISHKLPEVWQISHRISVMRDGYIALNGKIDEINKDDVIKAITPKAKKLTT